MIYLQQMNYFLEVGSLSSAETSFVAQAEQPEITASMSSLEEFLKTYENITTLMETYKQMLQEDVDRLRGAGSALVSAEQLLLR